MLDWLLSPIDATRAHDVGLAISWHARLMVLGWGVLAPAAVIVARFFKIWPGQRWPQELDNLRWWRSHWMGQSIVVGLSLIAFALVLPTDFSAMTLHNWLGYVMMGGLIAQILLGLFRGSKGGPTAPTLRGHHYDMTAWRVMFETLHKSLGYGLLGLAMLTILLGLWKSNAPVWMWIVLPLWWATLLGVFIALQRRGMAVDTYQAIWGDDPNHPRQSAARPRLGGTPPQR